MFIHCTVLVAAGSLCLTITLVLAWRLAGVRALGLNEKVVSELPILAESHMDYLLMTGLLMIFYLLFAQLHVSASPVILAAMSLGSLDSRDRKRRRSGSSPTITLPHWVKRGGKPPMAIWRSWRRHTGLLLRTLDERILPRSSFQPSAKLQKFEST
jgi:hypothetical protein